MEIKCGKCNDDTSNYCSSCSETFICPSCQNSVWSKMKYDELVSDLSPSQIFESCHNENMGKCSQCSLKNLAEYSMANHALIEPFLNEILTHIH